MPGLYGFTANSNVSVNVGNTTGLYQQNTGNVYVVNNAVTLLNTLSQAGNVNFALTDGNSKVLAYTANIGTPAGTYGNATSVPIITVTSDGRVTNITNLPIGGASFYSNTNVAAYLTTATIATSGNITAGNLISANFLYPNGVSILSGIGGTYSNTNVSAYLTTATINTSGNITAANLITGGGVYSQGNVTAPNFVGNVTLQPTGVTPGTYGADNAVPVITVSADGRVTVLTTTPIGSGGGAYGNANVQAYLPTYSGAMPNLSSINTSGNITANAGGYFNGDGSKLTNLPVQAGTYSNTNVAAYLTTATITTTGNVTAANLTTAGNVYGSYIIGNGSLLTNLPVQTGTYSNTNVSALLSSNTVTTIATTGNITTVANVVSPNYLYPNGVSILTGIGGTYSNTNVAAYLTTATIDTTGNITAANLVTGGNVSGSYIIGNGSLLTNLPVQAGTYSNTNVAAYLTTATIATSGNITAANLTTGGNVTANYIKGDGSLLTGLTGAAAGVYGSDTTIPSIQVDATGRIISITSNAISGGGSYGNANVTALLSSNTVATITTTGNITTVANIVSPNYLYPNGVSILTGIGGTYSNVNVAAYLPNYGGQIQSTNQFSNVFVQMQYSPTLPVDENTLGLGNWAFLDAGGFVIQNNTAGRGYTSSFTYDLYGNLIIANGNIITTGGNVVASYFKGDGSLLTNLPVQAGTYSNANVASYLPVFGGNILAGNIDIPYTSGTRNRGPLAIGGNLNHYDSGVVASFQGDEATYLYTSLQNTNTGNTAYSSYAVNDATHTYYGELGINSGTYDYAAAGYPNNAFSLPYATFIQSTGANLAVGTYSNHGISFLVNGQTKIDDAMTIANTGNVSVTGNLAVGSQATVGNIKSTSGYFWANSAVYDGFSGDLVSRTLTASGTGRILANAYPQSNVTAIAGGYTQAGITAVFPSYTSGNLNSQNQVVTMTTMGNVNFLTTFANATTRTTIGTFAYLGATATSANTAMNTSDRIRAFVGGLDLNLNGKSWGAMSTASQSISPAAVNGQTFNLYGTGNMGHAISIGAVMAVNPVSGALNVQYASANFPAITQLATNSPTACSITYARLYGGVISGQSGNVTVTNAIGLHTHSGWVSSNVSLVTNAYTVLNEDTRSVIQTAGNIVVTSTSNVILGAGQMVSYRDKITALGTTSGSITLNGSVAPSWTITLDNTLTLSNSTFTNYSSGASVTLIITQDGTGGRTLSTSQIKWAGGVNTLSTAAGAIDIANFYYDGTTWYGALVKGYV